MLTLQETIRPSSLTYEEYKRMKARIELLEILAEAENDVKNEAVAPMCETFDDLRDILREKLI